MAGSIGLLNNPSSVLSSPDPWDVTVLGFQTRNLMNLLYVGKYNSAGVKEKLSVFFNSGEFKRNLNNNLNVNILNTRVRLRKRLAAGVGLNIRSITSLKSSRLNIQDTFPSIDSFFVSNFYNQPMGVSLISSTWSESYANISYNVIENKNLFWNVGASLKVTKGLVGFVTQLDNAQFSRVIPDFPFHNFTDVNLEYFYSRNIDVWSGPGSPFSKFRNHLKKSERGATIDIGMEWIIKDKRKIFLFENNPQYNYTWKIGLSVLDFGFAQYKNGMYSMNATGISPNINAVSLNKKFNGDISTFKNFNDTIKTLFSQSSPLIKKIRIAPPARFVVNIDRIINQFFAINADLNMPVNILPSKKFYNLSMMPSLTLTPRVELRKYGAYFPVTLNGNGNFWMGLAVRTGPILLGLHNVQPFVSRSPFINGGGYISYILSPSNKVKKEKTKDIDCPK